MDADDVDLWWTRNRPRRTAEHDPERTDHDVTAAIRERAVASLAPYSGGSGFHVPGLALMISARRTDR
jgi:hypothetical protein